MVDTKQEVIQELKDILKDLGFQENKKILGYVKKIHNRLNLYISFVNPDAEIIDISCIDISSTIKIKGVYYWFSGIKTQSFKEISLLEFSLFLGNKTKFIITEINIIIKTVLALYLIESKKG